MSSWSLHIGRFKDIELYIHWTFWILIGWGFLLHFQMGHGWEEGLAGAIFIMALFFCVLLHEFGHALCARQFGIPTKDITLYPIGGVASLYKMPDKPVQELAVALAGPGVNVIIAALIYTALLFTDQLIPFTEMDHMGLNNFWAKLMIVNVVLAVFNLIPAFPLDGGRVLRAVLSFKLEKLTATMIAARIGQFLAILFVFLGFFFNFWLIFIGLFIFLGAGGEASYEKQKALLSDLRVQDVMVTSIPQIPPYLKAGVALKRAMDNPSELFFVSETEQARGILTLDHLLDAMRSGKSEIRVSDLMQTKYPILSPKIKLTDALERSFFNESNIAAVLHEGNFIGILSKKHTGKYLRNKFNKIQSQ